MISKNEFLQAFEVEFENSPSTSDADNELTHDILKQMRDNNDLNTLDVRRCLLSWQTKQMPRYFVNDNNQKVPDVSSQKWSPGYHRLDPALSEITTRMKDTKVLDPFAGSGSMIFSLIALDITNSVTVSDKCYKGGSPIVYKDDPLYYSPADNWLEYIKLFERFKNLVPLSEYYLGDTYSADVVNGLPYNNGEFDWIYADPPYGKNLGCGSNTIFDYLPEMMRVSRNGALLLMPENWLTIIDNSDKYKAENLTGPLNKWY